MEYYYLRIMGIIILKLNKHVVFKCHIVCRYKYYYVISREIHHNKFMCHTVFLNKFLLFSASPYIEIVSTLLKLCCISLYIIASDSSVWERKVLFILEIEICIVENQQFYTG